MRILYLIFVLCVGALVWVAVAAARHIRRQEAGAGLDEKPSTGEVTGEAGVLVPADKS